MRGVVPLKVMQQRHATRSPCLPFSSTLNQREQALRPSFGMRIRLLLGAVCRADSSAMPAFAQESSRCDEFLRDAKATGAGWFSGLKSGIMDVLTNITSRP